MKEQLIKYGIPILLILGAAFMYQKYNIPPTIEFMEMSTTDLDGTPVDINQYAGKNIFITMWAPWCKDCIAEMPSIQNLAKAMNSEDFVVLAISGYDIAKEKNFKEKNPYNFVYLHMNETLADVGIHSIPTNYIINKAGEVVYEKVGGENWSAPAKIEEVKALLQ